MSVQAIETEPQFDQVLRLVKIRRWNLSPTAWLQIFSSRRRIPPFFLFASWNVIGLHSPLGVCFLFLQELFYDLLVSNKNSHDQEFFVYICTYGFKFLFTPDCFDCFFLPYRRFLYV